MPEDGSKWEKRRETAPDGGWGWVVVLACLTIALIMDGTMACYGLFYPEIIRSFKTSAALASLAGSLNVGVMLIIAPVIGTLIKLYGCRPVCFIGGLIAAIGVGISVFPQSLVTFMLTYGIVSGVGMALYYLPSVIAVNLYFSQKRGIAQGLMSSGSGLGVIIMSHVIEMLIETYAWRGALLILGGIVLHICICGALLRPLEKQYEVSVTNNNYTESVHNLDEIKSSLTQTLRKSSSNMTMDNQITLSDKQSNAIITPVTSFLKRQRTLSDSFRNDKTEIYLSAVSLTDTSTNNKPVNNGRYEISSRHQAIEQNPMLRTDIFYSGSLHNLKEFRSQPNVNSYIDSMTEPAFQNANSVTSTSEIKKYSKTTECKELRRLFDFSLLKEKVFLPILLGAVLVQMAQFIPTTFLAGYGLTIGITRRDTAVILTVFGTMNILGRLSAGFLANCQSVNPLWVCNFSTAMCGVACAVFPFCNTFESLCAFAVALGYFIGYFPPLQPLILVHYIGLEKLTSSFAFLSMVKAPAAVAGPPIAGIIFSWTGSYGMSMVFASVLLFLSAAVQSLVPLIHKRCPVMKSTNEDFSEILE